MAFYGIDISEHNGRIDLSAYRDQFVMIRAGWGWSVDQKDKMFERNIGECLKYKIPFGVYWYSYAPVQETAETEADVFLEVIRPWKDKISMGVWVDQEDADGWKVKNGFRMERKYISEITSIMCEKIRREGYHAGIYCSYSWLKYLDDSCQNYDLWIAHWGTNDGRVQKDLSKICSVHQYASKDLDLDICFRELSWFSRR